MMNIPLQQNEKLRSMVSYLPILLTTDTTLADSSTYVLLELIYLCIIKPDISHVVGIVSKFVSALYTYHYATLLRNPRYLWGSVTRSLLFSTTSCLELRA